MTPLTRTTVPSSVSLLILWIARIISHLMQKQQVAPAQIPSRRSPRMACHPQTPLQGAVAGYWRGWTVPETNSGPGVLAAAPEGSTQPAGPWVSSLVMGSPETIVNDNTKRDINTWWCLCSRAGRTQCVVVLLFKLTNYTTRPYWIGPQGGDWRRGPHIVMGLEINAIVVIEVVKDFSDHGIRRSCADKQQNQKHLHIATRVLSNWPSWSTQRFHSHAGWHKITSIIYHLYTLTKILCKIP